MGVSRWQKCLDRLEGELTPQQFNTWIRPLHAVEDGKSLRLLAPNQFVRDWVGKHLAERISEVVQSLDGTIINRVVVMVGSKSSDTAPCVAPVAPPPNASPASPQTRRPRNAGLQPGFTFEAFVEGKSNQLARAASIQVSENPGAAYNPLFMYGGVGLGQDAPDACHR